MQTLETPVAVSRSGSKFNPSWFIASVVVLASFAVWSSGSVWLALALIFITQYAWTQLETLAVTVFLHRALTHGAFIIKKPWYVRWWLWWARSGMVKYPEWAQNHTAHHALTDTPRDSYTPRTYMEQIDMPPLRPPRPWRFLDNARAYSRTSGFYAEHPEVLQQLANEYPEVRRTLGRIEQLAWAEKDYCNTNRALTLNWALFSVESLALGLLLGGWWIIPTLFIVPWAMIGLKVYMYLKGGYYINFGGHQHKSWPYQSNIRWWLQLLTLFMMGEGWHRFHHDAPYSARFHFLDPGWWTIKVSAKLNLIGNIVVARRIGPRQYEPMLLQ